jgi:hypothetical protein
MVSPPIAFQMLCNRPIVGVGTTNGFSSFLKKRARQQQPFYRFVHISWLTVNSFTNGINIHDNSVEHNIKSSTKIYGLNPSLMPPSCSVFFKGTQADSPRLVLVTVDVLAEEIPFLEAAEVRLQMLHLLLL